MILGIFFLVQSASAFLGSESAWSAPNGCASVNVDTCDLEKDETCQDCVLGLSPVDENQITSVPIQCKSGAVFGGLDCSTYYNIVTNGSTSASTTTGGVRAKMGTAAVNYYQGKTVDWVSGKSLTSQTPVCNANDGETDKNFLGNSCGTYCQLGVDWPANVWMVGGTCQREAAWYRGVIIQAQNHYKEEVFGELQNKTIQLTSTGINRPCAPFARDVIRAMAASKALETGLTTIINDPTQAKQTHCQDTQNTQVGAANVQFDAGTLHAVCQQEGANAGLTYLLQNLVYCEIDLRTSRDFMTGDPNTFMAPIQSAIQAICEPEVKAKAGGVLDSGAKRAQVLNACYQREVSKAFQNQVNMKWKTTQPIEKQGSASGRTTSQQPPASGLIFAGGILSFLQRRRRNRWAGIVALFAVASIGAVITGCAKGVCAAPPGCTSDDVNNNKPGCSCSASSQVCGASSTTTSTSTAPAAPCPPATPDVPPSSAGTGTPPNPIANAGYGIRMLGSTPFAAKGTPLSQNITAGTLNGTGTGSKPQGSAASSAPTTGSLTPSSGSGSGGGDSGSGNSGGGNSAGGVSASSGALAVSGDQSEDIISKNVGFGGTDSTGGGAKKAGGSPFGGLFGGGAGAGAGGSGSAIPANFGAAGAQGPAAGADGDLEAYLAGNGKVSLFEVVNRRYYRWGTDLDVQSAKNQLRH